MDTTDPVARRIDNCRPRCMSPEAWTLAESQIRALVRAATPITLTDAKGLASTLCTFLSTPCGWLLDGAPDLKALLTDAAIEQFAGRFNGADRTRANHVGRLRTLQGALSGATHVPDPQTPARRRQPAGDRRRSSRGSMRTAASSR